MRKPRVDLFDSKTMADSDASPSRPCGSGSDSDFAFAFNNCNFSDRILRLEITPDLPESRSEGAGCSCIADWVRQRKRRREEIKKDNNVVDVLLHCEEEEILNWHMPERAYIEAYENQDEESLAMIEESPSRVEKNLDQHGDEAIYSEQRLVYSTAVRVKTLHISSPILAAKSPFFYKLFSNGMKESMQRNVTMRIHASEEAALMDLLNFTYSSTLTANTPTALLAVLMAADKFEVASCMRYCSRLLQNFDLTCESALLYLDLPSSVSMADVVRPLTDAAKQFLAGQYRDITKFYDEVLNLPLSGFEVVISSDDLQVISEDSVYDLVLKWVRTHYPKLEDRREVLGSHLGRHIRFPYMTCRKLKKVLTCNDFDPELASKVVIESLFFKAEAPHRQRLLAADQASTTSRCFLERTYKYRPVKVVEFELPRQQCVVYLDLKRGECANLFLGDRIYSQAFHLGGQGFFLSAHCNMDQQNVFQCFGLFLGMQEKGAVSFTVDYEFAARSKPTQEYVSKYKGNYTFTGGKAVGYRNLFGMPWTAFTADDSIYFINDILHIRAELTIRK